MTFSILARCPTTGRLGLATATFSLVVGARSAGIRSAAGVAKTQANPHPENDLLALTLMAQGRQPRRVLEILEANDPFWDYRQMGLLSADGHTAAHTGTKALHHAGHLVEHGLVVLGNVVAGPEVIEAMAKGFREHPSDLLEHRLVRALEFGRDAGGQARQGVWIPERSAVLRVAGRDPWLEIDLAVDRDAGAVEELHRVLDVWVCQSAAAG